MVGRGRRWLNMRGGYYGGGRKGSLGGGLFGGRGCFGVVTDGEEKAKVGESLEGNLEAEAPLAMEIKYGGIGEDIAEHGDELIESDLLKVSMKVWQLKGSTTILKWRKMEVDLLTSMK